jgi:pimeloyl-ACP methyl ester carboxylesterase
VIDGAGHYPHAETPDAVLALLLPFLAATLSPATQGDRA